MYSVPSHAGRSARIPAAATVASIQITSVPSAPQIECISGFPAARAWCFGKRGRSGDTKLYITYYRYASYTTLTPSTANLKQFYVFGNGVSGSNTRNPQPILHIPASSTATMNTGYAMGANTLVSYQRYDTAGWDYSNDFNAWARWEVDCWLNSAIGVEDGLTRVAKDCVVGVNDPTYAWSHSGFDVYCSHWAEFHLGYMDTGIVGCISDYSDYYVANTPARVELGNASTWAACTHREIQIAREANWSDTAITGVVLNRGSFGSFTNTYLYVVGSNGEPINTSGYLVA